MAAHFITTPTMASNSTVSKSASRQLGNLQVALGFKTKRYNAIHIADH